MFCLVTGLTLTSGWILASGSLLVIPPASLLFAACSTDECKTCNPSNLSFMAGLKRLYALTELANNVSPPESGNCKHENKVNCNAFNEYEQSECHEMEFVLSEKHYQFHPVMHHESKHAIQGTLLGATRGMLVQWPKVLGKLNSSLGPTLVKILVSEHNHTSFSNKTKGRFSQHLTTVKAEYQLSQNLIWGSTS